MGLRTKLITILLSAVTIAVSARAEGGNCIPVRSVEPEELAFQAGEKLDFVLRYSWGIINSEVGNGYVMLDTVRVGGKKCFHTRVFGKTAKFFDNFFRCREDFHSWFTCDRLQPVRFTRNTEEGDYKARNEYTYLWDAPSPYIDAQVYTTSTGDKPMQIPLKDCTFDLPALFFFARNIDMARVEQDVRYPMTFAIDDEVFDVYFVYRGKCTKKVKGFGKVPCMKFGAMLLKGQVFSGDEMTVYITDDDNRLPILFEAPLRVGDVYGRMTAASGLKYDMAKK